MQNLRASGTALDCKVCRLQNSIGSKTTPPCKYYDAVYAVLSELGVPSDAWVTDAFLREMSGFTRCGSDIWIMNPGLIIMVDTLRHFEDTWESVKLSEHLCIDFRHNAAAVQARIPVLRVHYQDAASCLEIVRKAIVVACDSSRITECFPMFSESYPLCHRHGHKLVDLEQD